MFTSHKNVKNYIQLRVAKKAAKPRKIARSGACSFVIPLDKSHLSDLYFVGFAQHGHCVADSLG